MLIVMELPLAYQLIIPEPVRDILGLSPGDWVAFEKEEDDKVIFRKFQPKEEQDEVLRKELNLVSDWIAVYNKDEKPEEIDKEDWDED